jgi:hypothetical protein
MGIPLSVLDPSSEDVDLYVIELQQPRFRCKLPVELLVIVTEFLLGEHAYGTAANLNMTCKAVHAETTSALYAVVVMRWLYFRRMTYKTTFAPFMVRERKTSSAYQNTRSVVVCSNECGISDRELTMYANRYLVVVDVPQEDPELNKLPSLYTPRRVCDAFPYQTLFPNAKMVIWKPREVDDFSEASTAKPKKSYGFATRYCTMLVFRPITYDVLAIFLEASGPVSGLQDTQLQYARMPVPSIEGGDYVLEDKLSKIAIRGEGCLILSGDDDAFQHGQTQLGGSLSRHQFFPVCRCVASSALKVSVLRHIMRMGDEDRHGREWKLRVEGSEDLLPKFMIAVSRVA